MVETVLADLGRIDVLVCNAGGALVPGVRMASEMPAGDFLRMLDINLIGTVNACQAVVPHMQERGSGKIVTVGLATSSAIHSS